MFLLLCVDANKSIELEPSLVSVNLTGTQLGLCQFDRFLCQVDRDVCQFDRDLCQFDRGQACSLSI